jgi:hypothetical protein
VAQAAAAAAAGGRPPGAAPPLMPPPGAPPPLMPPPGAPPSYEDHVSVWEARGLGLCNCVDAILHRVHG